MQKLKNNEARQKFTGSYLKKVCIPEAEERRRIFILDTASTKSFIYLFIDYIYTGPPSSAKSWFKWRPVYIYYNIDELHIEKI